MALATFPADERAPDFAVVPVGDHWSVYDDGAEDGIGRILIRRSPLSLVAAELVRNSLLDLPGNVVLHDWREVA
jgi:hypothetical protein